MDNIPCLKSTKDEYLIEFPLQEKNIFEKVLDLLYFGNEHTAVDDGSEDDGHEHEIDTTLEENIETVVEIKLENLRLSLRRELKGIQSEIKDDLEKKIGKLIEKLK